MPVDAGVLHVGGLRGDERLTLLDATGRLVAVKEAVQRPTLDLAITGVPGLYLLRVERAGKEVAVRRVVVR